MIVRSHHTGPLMRKRAMAVSFLGLACLLLLSHCSVGPSVMDDGSPFPQGQSNEAFRLGPGDELTVRFFYHPQLDETLIVSSDGKIYLQLIGEIHAAGLRIPELAQSIRDNYADVLKDPEVTVVLKSLGTREFFIGGEVKNPGAFPLRPQTSLAQAIMIAGGLLPTANPRQIFVFRKSADDSLDVKVFDFKEMVKQKRLEAIYLAQFDVVYVSPTLIAEVDKFVEQYINKVIPQQVPWMLWAVNEIQRD